MKITAIMATLVLALSLGACNGMFEASLPADSPGKAALQSVPPGGEGTGKAHLYIYLGRVHGQVFSHANGRKSEFYINDIDVGPIGSADCLYVELEPGVYNFSWRSRHDLLGPVQSHEDSDMVQPGQEIFLALNIKRNAGSLFGPLSWLIDPDTGHIADTYPRGRAKVAGRQVLRLSAAIQARIHPLAGPGTYLPASW